MTIYYSTSTSGFYDTDVISYPVLPDDIIEVTNDQYLQFLNDINTNNKEIKLIDGILQTVDIVRTISWNQIKQKRNDLLSRSDYTQLPDYKGNQGSSSDWATYRQTLRDIPQNQTDPNNIIWPDAPK